MVIILFSVSILKSINACTSFLKPTSLYSLIYEDFFQIFFVNVSCREIKNLLLKPNIIHDIKTIQKKLNVVWNLSGFFRYQVFQSLERVSSTDSKQLTSDKDIIRIEDDRTSYVIVSVHCANAFARADIPHFWGVVVGNTGQQELVGWDCQLPSIWCMSC